MITTMIINNKNIGEAVAKIISTAIQMREENMVERPIYKNFPQYKNFREEITENRNSYLFFEEKGIEIVSEERFNFLQELSYLGCNSLGEYGHIIHTIKLVYTE